MDLQQADEVLPRLFISSLRVAETESELRRHGITHVLTVCPIRPRRFPNVEYHLVSIPDSPNHHIDSKFSECFSFINRALAENGSVLVHCFQGVSRSASVIIAYLITFQHLSFEAAHSFLLQKRSQIKPNFGFLKQLKKYSKSILNKNFN